MNEKGFSPINFFLRVIKSFFSFSSVLSLKYFCQLRKIQLKYALFFALEKESTINTTHATK